MFSSFILSLVFISVEILVAKIRTCYDPYDRRVIQLL